MEDGAKKLTKALEGLGADVLVDLGRLLQVIGDMRLGGVMTAILREAAKGRVDLADAFEAALRTQPLDTPSENAPPRISIPMTNYELLKADPIALRQALWEVATKAGKFSSQREFAEAVGMIPSAFYRFFQNDNDSKPQKKTIDAMAKALGITELAVRRTHRIDEFLNRSKRGKIQS